MQVACCSGNVVCAPQLLYHLLTYLSDPLFQRTLATTIRSNPQIFTDSSSPTPADEHTWTGLPLVHDEVFTGLHRLGVFTPSSALHIHPDIVVHAKLLTGGLLPLCTTTASTSIFESFLGDTKAEALLHGHSYTAHAIGCEVANKSLDTMLAFDREGGEGNHEVYKRDWAPSASSTPDNEWQPYSVWSHDFITSLSHSPRITSVIALGTVLAISLQDAEGAGYSSDAAVGLQKQLLENEGRDFNVHSRTLGNVVYVMASLTSERKDLRKLEQTLSSLFEEKHELCGDAREVEVGAEKRER